MCRTLIVAAHSLYSLCGLCFVMCDIRVSRPCTINITQKKRKKPRTSLLQKLLRASVSVFFIIFVCAFLSTEFDSVPKDAPKVNHKFCEIPRVAASHVDD